MQRKLLLVAALAFSMSAQARHGAVTLVDPPPLPVPQGTADANVEKAIISSGVHRNWKVVERKPGAVVLEYAPRDFSVRVTVTHDAKSVHITYADSNNLEYGQEDGHAVIHPNYNRWVNNLAHDIEGELTLGTVK